MHIKRFTAQSVKEAIKDVKKEFGEDALILSTKKLSEGLHEVVAAMDIDISNVAPAAPATTRNRPEAPLGVAPKTAGKAYSGVSALVDGPVSEEAPAKKAPFEEKPLTGFDVEKELGELKRLFVKMLNSSRTPFAELYSTLHEQMLECGIDKTLADKILTNTFKAVSAGHAGDEGFVKEFIRKKMTRRLDVSNPLDKKSIVAFVGPAGVGKTTTIAKLAAIHALKKKRSLALLSMDTYRIAAADQLKAYGKMIGVPVEVARDSSELKAFIDLHRDKDHILIDTSGRSPRSTAHLGELARVASIEPRIRFNLVLSSQTRDTALYGAVKGFGAVPIDSLTFTKLDEADTYGPVVNATILANKPVAYLTNGQRVPEDIELATKHRLVNFLMPN